MADFVSENWGTMVLLVTLVSIAACGLLAWSVSRAHVTTDETGQVGTTGHVWDEDLEELNNPLPRWWLYLFYGTCVFGLLYLFLYPGLGGRAGWFEWSSSGQYEREAAAARAVHEPLFAAYLEQPVAAVAEDATAVAMGERLYLTYCSQCHGSDARGARSFPNLADADWLGPATADHVKNTVLNGRVAVMPPMLAALGNSEAAVAEVAHHVLSLSGSDHDPALAAAGQARYAVCAACHGPDGNGNPAIGAPNLTDETWLYGGSLASVERAVREGFDNRMPAFGELLGEGKAHVAAAYVWSLSAEGRAALDGASDEEDVAATASDDGTAGVSAGRDTDMSDRGAAAR